ncbi:TPA: hypothetical protein ENX78_11405 [Candidatus Poribacteria bacterium]|nr:hypothetical protein [Candidatus Poribacteria bacterium]
MGKRKNVDKSKIPEAVKKVLENEPDDNSEVVNVKGIEVKPNNCYKLLIGKMIFYVKVLNFTENPYVVICQDYYSKKVSLDFRKASLIAEYSCDQFERRRKNK